MDPLNSRQSKQTPMTEITAEPSTGSVPIQSVQIGLGFGAAGISSFQIRNVQSVKSLQTFQNLKNRNFKHL